MRLASIVVPVLNRPDLTRRCLESVVRNTTPPYELIVVDNGSDEATRRMLREFPGRVLRNPRNLGFARAVNRGIRASKGDVVVLLNSDTEVPKGWVKGMRSAMTGNIGLVGPATDGARNGQRRAGPSRSRVPVRLPILYGFCLMIRREAIRDLGLMDERFFPGGFEDVDYCLRAAEKGWRCSLAPWVFVRHAHHASWKANGIDHGKSIRVNYRRFLAKWSGSPMLALYAADGR